MPWVYLVVSLVGAAFVVNAFFPFRREPLTIVSFALGWIAGELPIQMIVVQSALDRRLRLGRGLPVLAWMGGPGRGRVLLGWPGPTGGGQPSRRRPGEGVARRGQRGPGARRGNRPVAGVELLVALAIAVPFRWRSIRRLKNIDYWGDGNYRHRLDILQRRTGHPNEARCSCTSTVGPG